MLRIMTQAQFNIISICTWNMDFPLARGQRDGRCARCAGRLRWVGDLYTRIFMCVYIYIYVYIHTHAYIHTYIHTFIHTYIYIYIYIYNTCMYAFVYWFINVLVFEENRRMIAWVSDGRARYHWGQRNRREGWRRVGTSTMAIVIIKIIRGKGVDTSISNSNNNNSWTWYLYPAKRARAPAWFSEPRESSGSAVDLRAELAILASYSYKQTCYSLIVGHLKMLNKLCWAIIAPALLKDSNL